MNKCCIDVDMLILFILSKKKKSSMSLLDTFNIEEYICCIGHIACHTAVTGCHVMLETQLLYAETNHNSSDR